MQDLCRLMGVSRSGYYKWKKRGKSQRDLKREETIALVSEVHNAQPATESTGSVPEPYFCDLGYRGPASAGDRDGLADVVELLRNKKEPTIIHTDQGSVYSSKAYNELIRGRNIVRSMSRAGKPTDNPVNEALEANWNARRPSPIAC